MDPRHFDALARAVTDVGTRRRLLGLLASLPLLGGRLAFLADDNDVAAAGRRRRRKKRHKHGKGRRRKHGNHKRKPKCSPESVAQTCANTCGSVTNNCQQAVDCGSCTCTPTCDVCFTCQDGPNTPGTCVVDPDQVGDACGSGGQVCQSDGSCACDAASCGSCQTCGGDGACVPCAACCDIEGVCQDGETNEACGASGTCAVCTMPETCGGGGTPRTCGCKPAGLSSTCSTPQECCSGFCQSVAGRPASCCLPAGAILPGGCSSSTFYSCCSATCASDTNACV